MSPLLPLFCPGSDEAVFSIESNNVKFGPGALGEVGLDAREFGLRRVLLVTDGRVRRLPPFDTVYCALVEAGIGVAVFDGVAVEPTEAAILAAAEVAGEAGVDGFVSLGGGSVMDTAKAANLLVTWLAPLADYVAAPLGKGLPVPGPLKPHIACPTTFGTAAETTGNAVFDLPAIDAKTGIVSRALRPTLGVLDPLTLDYLPPLVLAANAFDLLSHAIESYTARPFTARPRSANPLARPLLNQGANPYAAGSCLEAVSLVVRHLERAVQASADRAARSALMYAGLLAGAGFGNAGNHLPHAMSYPVSHHVRDWRAQGWPGEGGLIPHGIAVALNAPAAFRHAGPAAPERFADVLTALGGRPAVEPGAAVADIFINLMRATGLPCGLSEVGYNEADLPLLAAEAHRQRRLIDNAPAPVMPTQLEAVFRDAMRYW